MKSLPKIPQNLIDRVLDSPGEVHTHGAFVAVAGGIVGHIDESFPEWSAFVCLRNDNCRIWQRGGYHGKPKVGERFMLNIHQRHGVIATGAKRIFVALCADGHSQETACKNLAEAEANGGKI